MNFALGSTYGNVGSVSVIGKWSNLLWSLKSLMVTMTIIRWQYVTDRILKDCVKYWQTISLLVIEQASSTIASVKN